MPTTYQDGVFLNVPFDKKYGRLFDALVFAVHDCGFIARSALEVDDSRQARVLKILDIIEQSKYGTGSVLTERPYKCRAARLYSIDTSGFGRSS